MAGEGARVREVPALRYGVRRGRALDALVLGHEPSAADLVRGPRLERRQLQFRGVLRLAQLDEQRHVLGHDLVAAEIEQRQRLRRRLFGRRVRRRRRRLLVSMRLVSFKRALIAAAIAFATLSPFAASRAETEAIESFDAAIDVGADGRITVAETIVYRFPEPRHGIYRDLPVRYDEGGKTLEAPVTLLGVTDGNGRPLTTKLERG